MPRRPEGGGLPEGFRQPLTAAAVSAAAFPTTTTTPAYQVKKKRKAKARRGKLMVAITGVPAGSAGSATITGPHKYRKTVTTSTKLKKLRPGTYKATAKPFTRQGQAATLALTPKTVKIKAGKTATITIRYTWQAPTPTPGPTPTATATPTPTPAPTTPAPTPTPPGDTTPPGPVTGAAATGSTTSSITLSWTNPTDPDLAAVIVRRAQGTTAPDSPTAGTAVALPTPTAAGVTDTGLAEATNYAYAIFTRDTSGNTRTPAVTVNAGTAGHGATGAVTRINTAADGTQATGGYGGSRGPAWSPDGTRIAFDSSASNLVGGDTNNGSDVFIKTLP